MGATLLQLHSRKDIGCAQHGLYCPSTMGLGTVGHQWRGTPRVGTQCGMAFVWVALIGWWRLGHQSADTRDTCTPLRDRHNLQPSWWGLSC